MNQVNKVNQITEYQFIRVLVPRWKSHAAKAHRALMLHCCLPTAAPIVTAWRLRVPSKVLHVFDSAYFVILWFVISYLLSLFVILLLLSLLLCGVFADCGCSIISIQVFSILFHDLSCLVFTLVSLFPLWSFFTPLVIQLFADHVDNVDHHPSLSYMHNLLDLLNYLVSFIDFIYSPGHAPFSCAFF